LIYKKTVSTIDVAQGVRSINNKYLLKIGLEPAFVWYFSDSRFARLYKSLPATIDWRKFRWGRALNYAQQNRVLYTFCLKCLKECADYVDSNTLHQMNFIVSKGKSDLRRLRNTLAIVKDLWDEKVDYYVVKTRDDVATSDVDVMCKNHEDYEKAINIAHSHNYRFVREEPFKGWLGVEDGLKLELHHGISWFGMDVFDDHFLYRYPRVVRLMNLSFRTIGRTAEFALDLAHWVLDIQPLALNGFSKMIQAIEDVDSWEEVLDQAERFGWTSQLEYHLSALNRLCEYIYCQRLNLPIKLKNVQINPSMPFHIPAWSKIPFLMGKILRDNCCFTTRLNMLQLGLRRYAWTRLWQ
jgi:hypothetical protein